MLVDAFSGPEEVEVMFEEKAILRSNHAEVEISMVGMKVQPIEKT